MPRAFILSAKPALSRILSRIISTDISEKASEVVELSPAVDRFSPAAICLEGEFSKALSSLPSSSLDAQARMVQEGVHHHQATVAYCLKNALIADGSTYCGICYSNESNVKRRPLLAGVHNSYETLQLSSNLGSEIFFGHWLLDGTCQEIIAQDRGMGSVVHKRPPRFHEPGYRSILDLHPIEERVAQIGELWIVDDRGINDYKLARFSKILERIKKISDSESGQPEYIFLARRGGVDRNLSNELVLGEILERHGFHFVDCTNMSPFEIVKTFSAARIVVSVEGSHQSHAVLAMPSGGAIITVQPPTRVNLIAYRRFCDFKKIRQAFIIGEPQKNGFRVDPKKLLELIDLTLAVLSKNIEWT